MKKIFLMICAIVVLVFTYGCQSTIQNENIIITDEKVEIEGIQAESNKDEMIKEVLISAFSVTDADYNQNKIDYIYVLEERQNKVKNYFTDIGFDKIRKNRMMFRFVNNYIDYNCTAVLEDIELDYRETSKVDELVCYYNFNHKLTFKDSSIEPFEEMVSGEMTLYKYEGEWKIDYFRISNNRSYQTSFSKHLEASNIENGKVIHSKNEIENIINQILTDSCKIKLIDDSKLNTITQEPYNYMIVFEDSQIKCGSKDGEYDRVVYYDDVKYLEDESSLLFHINGVRKSNDDDSVIEVLDVDYYDKIIIAESEVIYLYKHRSNEIEVSIWWYSQE